MFAVKEYRGGQIGNRKFVNELKPSSHSVSHTCDWRKRLLGCYKLNFLSSGLLLWLREIDQHGRTGTHADSAFASHQATVLMPRGGDRVDEVPRGINLRCLEAAHETGAPLLDPLQPILGIGRRQPDFDKRDIGRPADDVRIGIEGVVAASIVTVVVIAVVTVAAVVRRNVNTEASAIVAAVVMTTVTMTAMSVATMIPVTAAVVTSAMMSASVVSSSAVMAMTAASTTTAMTTAATATSLSERFGRKAKHRQCGDERDCFDRA